jgi:hypothetical protein
MSVFQVKHVQAAQLGRMIQEIWGRGPAHTLRVSTDDRTNTLIVVADPEDTAQVKRLVTAVDVLRAESSKNERRQEVIPLKYIRADPFLDQELRVAIGGLPGGLSVDVTRNVVIVSGDEKTIQAVETLLARLDRPQHQQAISDMQVRIVWLASGLTRKETPGPPEDLKDVVAELNKLGIDNPRLVTQAIVTAQLGKQFRVEGLAGLDQPYRLSINGTTTGTAEAPRLQISVNATQATAPTGPPILNQIGRVETEITAPLGHSVVLGMTPTATSTSVFIVQILPKK